MLAVKAVLALDHADVEGITHRLGSVYQCVGDLPVRHGGEFDGGVFQTGVLEADGTGGHHNVAGLHVQVDAAAGAGADKGVRAALVQFLHGDSGGGAADAGGAGGDLFTQQRAGPDVELPVVGHLMGVIKQGGDGGHPARISGEDAIPAYVAGDAVNMKLLFQFLHDIHVPFTRPIRPADNLSYNR